MATFGVTVQDVLESVLSPSSHDLLSTLIEASVCLLRRKPALWIAGCLLGVLAALTLSTHAATWDASDGLSVVLAIAMAGTGLLAGWLTLEFSRRAVIQRRRGQRQIQQPADDSR